ncbi:MAG: YggS family pyridoxal phosphate-dependent enzyme, partial [Planctomycetota bacterium]
PHLLPRGLMTMGPLDDPDGAAARAVFARLSELAASIRLPEPRTWLHGACERSMGMSGDLEWAIAAGSTLVRIGTDLYSPVPDPA